MDSSTGLWSWYKDGDRGVVWGVFFYVVSVCEEDGSKRERKGVTEGIVT